MTVTGFAPLPALAGGVMIGAAAVLLMWTLGRIAGVSGIVSRLLPPYLDNATGERAAMVAGLMAAPFVYAVISGAPAAVSVQGSGPLVVAAGLLVGFGSVLGSGCTSGHGVCGLARFSPRSAVATGVFMAVAVAVVFITRHVIGG